MKNNHSPPDSRGVKLKKDTEFISFRFFLRVWKGVPFKGVAEVGGRGAYLPPPPTCPHLNPYNGVKKDGTLDKIFTVGLHPYIIYYVYYIYIYTYHIKQMNL